MTTFERLTADNSVRLAEVSQTRCGFITDLVWSPDGRVLAVAHGGGVAFWEGGFGGPPTRTLDAHAGPVKAIAFSPDGHILATASADITIKLSLVASAEAISTIRGHSDSVNAVAFSADGTLLASGGGDRTVRILNLAQTSRREILTGHGDEITAMDFSGRLLASASRDGTVRLWLDGQQAGVLHGHLDWVRDIAFSPDGKWLASGSRDHTVRLWDVATRQTIYTLEHDGDVRAVTFSPDSRLLATDNHGVAQLWDAREGRLLARLEAHEKPILSLAFHPNGQWLASGSGDNTMRLWGVAVEPATPPIGDASP